MSMFRLAVVPIASN